MYPRYAWIAYGWYAQGSWTNTNGNTLNCTKEELERVLEKGISVEVFPIPDDKSAPTIAGLVCLILLHKTEFIKLAMPTLPYKQS